MDCHYKVRSDTARSDIPLRPLLDLIYDPGCQQRAQITKWDDTRGKTARRKFGILKNRFKKSLIVMSLFFGVLILSKVNVKNRSLQLVDTIQMTMRFKKKVYNLQIL